MQKIIGYFSQIFKVSMPQKQVLQQLYTQISVSLTKSYQLPISQKYLKSLPIQSLLDKSVEFYVGSKSVPKNKRIMQMLLGQANRKALENPNQQKSLSDLDNVRYYSAYFVKMDAMIDDNPTNFDTSADTFKELAFQRQHPLSNYLIGKEMYKIIESGVAVSFHAQQFLELCMQSFKKSINKDQFGALYFLGDLLERQGLKGTDISQQALQQLYIQAASFGHPLALFKLAQIYKKAGNIKLYKKYLLQAAQNGVLEAKHNLGLEYLNGQFLAKNQVKALAWFINASAFGFVFSKYNASKLWENGSSCGRIKPNLKAALICLEEIHRSGEMDVQEQLSQLIKKIQDNGQK